MLFSLFGYRFIVFYPSHVKEFKQNHPFSPSIKKLPISYIVTFIILALTFRLSFLTITTAVQGDAVNYFWVAKYLWFPDQIDLLDPFWSNGFTFWQSFLFNIPLKEQYTPILATMIPGVYLVLPITRIAYFLFNKQTAIVVALLASSHPRLIEFSCNGYIDIFSLLFVILMVEQMIYLIYHRLHHTELKWKNAFLFGSYAAIAITTRNELIVFYIIVVLVFTICIIKASKSSISDHLQIASISTISFLLIIGTYTLLSILSLNSIGLFQKKTNIFKPISEQVNMEEASQWSYENKDTDIKFNLKSFAQRSKELIILTIQVLPGVIATPAILFTFFYFGFYPKKIFQPEYLPIICIGLIPFCIYPLINVEPRYLFSLLIPVLIFSGAGIVIFVKYIQSYISPSNSLPIIITTLCFVHALIYTYKAYDIENKYMIHQNLQKWVSYHIPKDEPIYGCGFGFVTTTGFLTGHRTFPRSWTESINELISELKNKHIHWVIIYEEYLEKANPSLLSAFRGFMPYLKQEFVTKDSRGYSAKVYYIP